MAELFGLKRHLGRLLCAVPHVVENEPAVCAWYPTAGKTLIWNLSEQPRNLTVAMQEWQQRVCLGPLQATTVKVALVGKS